MILTKEQKIKIIKRLQNEISTKEVYPNDVIHEITVALYDKGLTRYIGHRNKIAQYVKNFSEEQEEEIRNIARDMLKNECILKREFISKKGNNVVLLRLSSKILNYKEVLKKGIKNNERNS